MKANIGLGDYIFKFGPGYPMGGYEGRKHPSEGVHDEIHARSVVLELSGEKTCLVSIDFVGLEKTRVESTKRRISTQFGIPEQNILIAAIHTHSAPLNIQLFSKPYEKFEEVYEGIVESVKNAQSNLEEGMIKISKVMIKGAAFNRRDWDEKSAYIDEEATILVFEGQDGKLKGILYNFSNHPVVLEPSNLLISADWPYFTQEYIRSALGQSELFVMFINGTPGNTNPINSPMNGSKKRTFEDCKEIGDITAKRILEGLQHSVPLTGQGIKGIIQNVEIEADDVDKEEIFSFANGKVENDVFKITTVVQVLKIGDLAIVSAPGEYFPHIAKSIKEKSPFKYTFIAGYANDYIGYVGLKEHYEVGGYEMFMMSLNAEEGALLEKTSLELLNALK
jgi:neutral ceramidase